jgi:integrase
MVDECVVHRRTAKRANNWRRLCRKLLAIVMSDPMSSLWLNTLYAEYELIVFAFVAVFLTAHLASGSSTTGYEAIIWWAAVQMALSKTSRALSRSLPPQSKLSTLMPSRGRPPARLPQTPVCCSPHLVKRAGQKAKLPFQVHVHMLRHSAGYKLAGDGHDTRSIQDYLGHKDIRHTVRYTELSPKPFRDFWRD